MRLKIFFLVLSTVLLFNYCSFLDKDVKTKPPEPAEKEKVKVNEEGEQIPLEKIEPSVKLPKESVTEKEAEAIKKAAAVTPERLIFETGIASWYGGDFHGQRTANGEIYDMYKLTAAHKTLPFNTLVEVENLDNTNRVIVRINDRGPFLKDRIIDLSYKAAQKLGCDADGVAPVTLRLLDPSAVGSIPQAGTETAGRIERESITETDTRNDTPIPTPPPPPEEFPDSPYYLQAGAFSDKTNADKMLKNISIILPEVPFNIRFVDGLYKVVSGTLSSRSRADELKKILLDIDIDAFIKEGTVPFSQKEID
jgi:rare lipoprotein A